MTSRLSGMILFQSKEIVTDSNTYGAATTYVMVTSKTLGIGAAERSWGDVKCIKTGKRLHINDELLKKQSVIFRATSMEKSRILKDPQSSEQWILFHESNIKFDKVLELWGTEIERQATESIAQKTTMLCLFCAWVEPWEQQLLFKPTNHVSEAKFLKKYGGLKWLDPDNGNCECVCQHQIDANMSNVMVGQLLPLLKRL
eukprot:4641045-Ditylum_brightwellii.AAC.1